MQHGSFAHIVLEYALSSEPTAGLVLDDNDKSLSFVSKLSFMASCEDVSGEPVTTLEVAHMMQRTDRGQFSYVQAGQRHLCINTCC